LSALPSCGRSIPSRLGAATPRVRSRRPLRLCPRMTRMLPCRLPWSLAC
jgi:hypothetical protein